LQQDSETILEFNRRTDLLADQSGLNLSELPEILGFSKPSLFAYRSGKNRTSLPKGFLCAKGMQSPSPYSAQWASGCGSIPA
jgi:hypothetical protein